jgi:hypothetical protein
MQDFLNLTRSLPMLLNHAHKTKSTRIVIIIDSADQLDSEYHGLRISPDVCVIHAYVSIRPHTSAYVRLAG